MTIETRTAETGQEHGIWGGLTEDERQCIQHRQHGAATAPAPGLEYRAAAKAPPGMPPAEGGQ